MPKIFTKTELEKLTKYFPSFPSTINRFKQPRIDKIVSDGGFENVRGFKRFWTDMLNTEISNEKKAKRNEKARQKRKELKKAKEFEKQVKQANKTTQVYANVAEKNQKLQPTAYTLQEIGDQVQVLREGKEKEPFELVLKSYINPKMKRIYKFKNIYHFNQWERQVMSLVEQSADSTGRIWSYYDVDDAFKYATFNIIDVAGGASTKRDSNALKPTRIFKGAYQKFTVRQVHIQHNNCGLECVKHLLGLDVSYLTMRKFIGKSDWQCEDKMLTFGDIYKVYNHWKQPNQRLCIHDIDSDIKHTKDSHHVLYHKNHYYVILNVEEIPFETDDKVKRGVIYWDIETRKTEKYCMIGQTKSYYLKDTILHAHVKKYKSDTYEHIYFETNEAKSSCRQFLDWLQEQGRQQRYYYLYAHNGGNFDTYFLLMNFTDEEEGKYTPTLRGTTVIKLEYGNNIFLDSYCFLPQSLHSLSKSFKVKQEKMKSFVMNGQELTNEQLCFYKPELTFEQFMQLKTIEPEFWSLYSQYCYIDCVALQQIWDYFSESIEKLIKVYVEKAPHRKHDLLTKCQLRQSCTIGGHAQKILDTLNGVKTKKSYDYQNYEKFIGSDKDTNFDEMKEKHDFIMHNFKRGGISHCNKKGKHTEGVMSVDICSQYPASLVHMKVPTGYSTFTDEYHDPSLGINGFYILRNLKFDTKHSFKPVCEVLSTGVLNWKTSNTIDRLALDSYMIEYLKEHYGLVSFDVERGLVSNYEMNGSKLFGDYVLTLFDEKATQDEYKKNDDDNYNQAYRETIKLYLNSITGKLVMDREKYTSLVAEPFLNMSTKEEKNKWIDHLHHHNIQTKNINGVTYRMERKDNLNNWVTAGVMVYSYSKRLLFEYIRQMPNNSDDVIHVETDSIYFPIVCEKTFNENIDNYDGDYPVKYGNELGNIKVEKRDNDVCYFLNKKVYTIGGNYIWKGIPKRTLLDDGTEHKILTKEMYEKVFNHKKGDNPITAEYMTMSRTLWGQTRITGHRQVRTLNSTYDYNTY